MKCALKLVSCAIGAIGAVNVVNVIGVTSAMCRNVHDATDDVACEASRRQKTHLLCPSFSNQLAVGRGFGSCLAHLRVGTSKPAQPQVAGAFEFRRLGFGQRVIDQFGAKAFGT